MIADSQEQAVEQQGKDYLEAGLALVPLHAGQKRPTGVGWNDNGNVITDPADWFVDAAGCGLAHVQSHTGVLDVDDYHTAVDWLFEHGIDLVALQMRDGAVQIVSGKKNRAKLLFKLPDGVDSLETRQPEGSGLELRCAASNGKTMQDVLPPSIHPDTGKPYTWMGDWKHLPTLPAPLLGLWQSLPSRATITPDLGDDEYLEALGCNDLLIGGVKGKPGAYEIVCPWAGAHTNGDKVALYFEPHTNGYAGPGFKCLHAHCADRGIDDLARFLGVPSMATLTLGGEPISRNSTLAAATAVPDEPQPLFRTVPPSKPFPLESLGPVLSPMAQCLVDTVCVPPGLCGQSVLSAAALAAQTHADVVMDDIRNPLSLFLFTVGRSGERKSFVDGVALRPIRAFERKLHERMADDLKAYRIDLAYWEAKEKAAMEAAKDGNKAEAARLINAAGREPVPPAIPDLIVSDPTTQGLVKQLVSGWPSVGLFSDEGAVFLGGWSMQAENQASSGGYLSEQWDGKPVKMTRSTGEPMPKLFGRRVSLHLMAQPSVAPMLLGNSTLHGQGLLSRFLASWPESTIGCREYSDGGIHEDSRSVAYQGAIGALLELEPRWSETLPNTLDPIAMKVETHGKEALLAFYWEVEQKLGAGGSWEVIADLGSKVIAHVCRIAAVLTLISNPVALAVSAADIERAIVLVRYYFSESLRLSELALESPDLVRAQKLLAWSQQQAGKYAHLSQIYQLGPYGIRDKATALRTAEVLEEHNWFVRLPAGTEVGGKSRRLAWEVRA